MNPEENISGPKGSFLKKNKTVLIIAVSALIVAAVIAGILLLKPGNTDKMLRPHKPILTPTPGSEIHLT